MNVPEGYALDAEGNVVPVPDGFYVREDGTLAEMSEFQKRSAARQAADRRPDPRDLHPLEDAEQP